QGRGSAGPDTPPVVHPDAEVRIRVNNGGSHVSFVLLAIVALGTLLLSGAQSLAMGLVAAVLIGFGTGGESAITPCLLSPFFGLLWFATLSSVAGVAAGGGRRSRPDCAGSGLRCYRFLRSAARGAGRRDLWHSDAYAGPAPIPCHRSALTTTRCRGVRVMGF